MAHPDFDREIRITRTIKSDQTSAWNAWATGEGLQAWWVADLKVEARVGGAYELYFLTDNPSGTRGGEGNTILSLEPESRLAFSWNSPPSQPQTRSQHTVVELRFTALSPSTTEVELLHRGFGPGPAWDKTYTYFQAAWTMVMDRFLNRLEA